MPHLFILFTSWVPAGLSQLHLSLPLVSFIAVMSVFVATLLGCLSFFPGHLIHQSRDKLLKVYLASMIWYLLPNLPYDHFATESYRWYFIVLSQLALVIPFTRFVKKTWLLLLIWLPFVLMSYIDMTPVLSICCLLSSISCHIFDQQDFVLRHKVLFFVFILCLSVLPVLLPLPTHLKIYDLMMAPLFITVTIILKLRKKTENNLDDQFMPQVDSLKVLETPSRTDIRHFQSKDAL